MTLTSSEMSTYFVTPTSNHFYQGLHIRRFQFIVSTRETLCWKGRHFLSGGRALCSQPLNFSIVCRAKNMQNATWHATSKLEIRLHLGVAPYLRQGSPCLYIPGFPLLIVHLYFSMRKSYIPCANAALNSPGYSLSFGRNPLFWCSLTFELELLNLKGIWAIETHQSCPGLSETRLLTGRGLNLKKATEK